MEEQKARSNKTLMKYRQEVSEAGDKIRHEQNLRHDSTTRLQNEINLLSEFSKMEQHQLKKQLLAERHENALLTNRFNNTLFFCQLILFGRNVVSITWVRRRANMQVLTQSLQTIAKKSGEKIISSKQLGDN